MKCIACNSTFELSKEDEKVSRIHEPAFCSGTCFTKWMNRPPTEDDMWNIHKGESQDTPKCGSCSGQFGTYGYRSSLKEIRGVRSSRSRH